MKHRYFCLIALLMIGQSYANSTFFDCFPIKIDETTTVTPTFSLPSAICSGTTAPSLPTTSNNGIAGTWSPSTISNTASGTYTFTPNGGQDATSVTVSINVVQQPNAGIDGSTTICDSSTASIDLNSLITGEQGSGIWVRISGTGGTFNAASGIFTPAPGATTSAFIYTITAIAPCIDDNSVATVNINQQPSSGVLAGNQNICVGLTSTFFSTQTGGTWSTSNPAVATVNSATGVVSGNSVGNAIITYTIPGAVPCGNASTIIAVSVDAATLTLNSAPATSNQIVCVNSPISSIIYTTANGTAAPIVTGLPSGVTGSVSGGMVTIEGAPSVVGTYNYMVSSTGNCGNAMQHGVITVSDVTGDLNLFCDTSQALPNAIYFDWTNIPGFTSYQYSYSIENGPAIPGSTNISNYQVMGVFPGQSVTFTLTNVVGLPCIPPVSYTCNLPLANDSIDDRSFGVYPNPVANILNLDYPQIINEVSMFNIHGQLVFHQLANTDYIQVDMSQFLSGVYLVEILSGNSSETLKILKN